LYIANARRAGIIKPNDERLLELTEGRAARNEDDISRMLSQTELQDSVTAAEAADDARVLLNALRQIYGAYTYFGGDGVFLPIFDEINGLINTAETWSAADLTGIFQDNLKTVIMDNHFFLGDRILSVSADFYVGAGADRFDLTDMGFIDRESGRLVTHIEGYSTSDVFRLSMDNQGDFYYIPVVSVIGETATSIRLNVTYDSGETRDMRLVRHSTARREFKETSLRYENGIPVVTVMIMGFDLTNGGLSEAETLKLLNIAEEIKDEPVIIVDMRSNYGGCGILPAMWFEIIYDAFVPTNFFHFNALNYDMFMQAIQADTGDRFMNERNQNFIKYLSPIPFDELHTIYYSGPDDFIENDKLLILLTDRYSVSSAEMFTDMTLNIQNTVIIGQNTSGTLHTESGYFMLRLPNSGIPFMLGGGLFIHPESESVIETRTEGVGIAPDIWVVFDALEAAFALLGLNN
jgi:hypothetical protein